MKWIELAASQGHAQAQCFLGNELLRKGLDTADLRSAALKTSDVLAAKEWYDLASRAGCAEASFNLGVMLHDGVSVDPPTLLPADSESASTEQSSRSSTKAASTAAQEERKGTSVLAIAEDLPRSLTYFELAARQGEAAASLWCGYCFSTGEGGAEAADQRKAEEHLRAAAAETQTAAKANFYLAQLHRPAADRPSAAGQGAYFHHLRLAVDLGDEDGQYTLADLHLKAHFSHADEEEVDLSAEERTFAEEDCRLRRPTTSSTTASVCGDVGHVHGEHCAHDHHHEHHHHQHLRMQAGDAGESGQGHLERAVELLRAASAAGHASATLTLGALVYQGLVQCDPAAGSNPKRSAFELYNLAAEQGSLEAWRNIASMHFLGDGVPKCESTAREIMRVMFAK
jgi:TPR repeat protein